MRSSFVACTLILLMIAAPVLADAPTPIPPTNDDLQAIIASANAITQAASQCDEKPCPVIDCAQAEQTLQALRNLESALDGMSDWLIAADADYFAAYQDAVATGEISGTNLEYAQNAFAVQQFLFNLGSMLLDLASVSDAVENFGKDWKEIADAIRSGDASKLDKFGDMAKFLDGKYETLKDAESLVDTAADQFAPKVATEGTGPINDAVSKANDALGTDGLTDINSVKSDVSDLSNIMESLRDGFKESGGAGKIDKLKDALKNVDPRTIGQLTGRIVKGIAANDMAKRKKFIETLNAQQASENGQIGQRFLDWQRTDERMYMTLDALAAVRAAYRALSACVTRLCPGSTMTRPSEPKFKTWGKALVYYNARIAQLEEALRSAGTVSVRNDCPDEEDATACPPCRGALRRFLDEKKRYEETKTRFDEGKELQRVVDSVRQARDTAWDELVQCVKLQCPGSDISQQTGALPGGPPSQYVEKARCPACQPIADQQARVRAGIEQRQTEIDELEHADIDSMKARLTERERHRSDLRRTLSNLREGSKSTAIGPLPVARELVGRIQELTGEIRRVTLEIGQLDRRIKKLQDEIDNDLPRLRDEVAKLRQRQAELRELRRKCEEEKCKERPRTGDEGWVVVFGRLFGVEPTDSGPAPFDPSFVDGIASGPLMPPPPSGPMADLSVTKTDSPDPVDAPGSLTYTIQVTNDGPDSAVNVLVEDTLPSGVSFQSVTTDRGTCRGSSTVTCDLGGLSRGSSGTITVVVGVSETTPSSIENTVHVASDTNDPVLVNNSATEATTVNHPTAPGDQADLSLGKTCDSTMTFPGENLTYTLSVENLGPATATNVQAIDPFPDGLTYDHSETSQGTCTFADSTVTCDLGDLPVDQQVQITIGAVVDDSTRGTLANTATLQADQTDPVTTNNSSMTTVDVQEPRPKTVQLKVTKTDTKDPVEPGEAFAYVLTVTNDGPDDASSVEIVDTLPVSAIAFDSAEPSMGSCTSTGAELRCSVPYVLKGETVTVTVNVHASSVAGDQTVTNSVSVTSAETDGNPADNTATETTTIKAPLQACALGIMPGTYLTTSGSCGSSGTVNVSCSGSTEVVVNDTINLTCDSTGACGDNNTIFGVGHHRCKVTFQGDGKICVMCERLDNSNNVVGTCNECFQKQP